MNEGYLILGINAYKFPQEGTGEMIEGVTVYYCDAPAQTAQQKGLFPMKITGTTEMLKDFTQLPAFYDIDFAMKPGSNGKPTVALRGVKFLRPMPK